MANFNQKKLNIRVKIVPGFVPSVTYPFSTPSIPIAIEVSGIRVSQSQLKTVSYKNSFYFYEFEPYIQKRDDLKRQPEGVYCDEQIGKSEVLFKPPVTFSFFEQVIVDDLNLGFTTEVR